jgi:hypothetical protein
MKRLVFRVRKIKCKMLKQRNRLNIGKIFGYALVFWEIYRCGFVK